jgi:hypothetical protein
MVDYSYEHLDSLFILSEDSPSGVAFKFNRYGGTNNKQILRKAGSPAGSRGMYAGTRIPLAWKITVDKVAYQAHRVVWVLNNGNILGNLIIDHLDGNPFNNSLSNLALKTTRQNNQNVAKGTRNTSGVVGVSPEHNRKGEFVIWAATWSDFNGVPHRKRFKIKEHGNDLAKQMAIEFRKNIIEELKAQGLSYTDRHGL